MRVQPGVGKLEHSVVGVADPLQHGEEARLPGRRRPRDDRAQRVDRLERHDELVLQEPADAVEPVPLTDLSSGWKNPVIDSRPTRCVGALRYHSSLNARTASRLSTFGIAAGTVASAGGVNASGSAAGRVPGAEVVERGVIAEREHGATEAGAARHEVDPRHRVPVVVVAGSIRSSRRRDWSIRSVIDQAPTRLDREHPERRVDDDAGEAHPADRRPPQLRIGVVGDRRARRPSASSSVIARDMAPEGAVGVVVLAVDVAGDRAADGDEPGPRRDRDEPAARHEMPQQLVEADTATDGDRAR